MIDKWSDNNWTKCTVYIYLFLFYYTPDRREWDNKRCFCPSVCPSVEYIANNSRTQRRSVPKFGRKVPHLRCDSHTSFKVKRSKVTVRGGREHTVSAEPGGHTVCFIFWREPIIIIIIIIINDSIYPAVSKASRTGNKVSCQPNDCPNR